ncbi:MULTISPECIES: TonB-dependent siderophore receptor [Dyella]|uniref:TonB-dependent siderophore receptor n=2 Tax=Dyella TaxID=231454 RepID=A0A4R0YUR5_9GAMM|nr:MULTISPECIES: TonB-dependent siderophore receptor [Dyella]TBR39360.1 TonB-dependent siderophore receptor [Dyella terrae]TCI13052.1 TonB-dependent siderophore receptor [Dyella soli]
MPVRHARTALLVAISIALAAPVYAADQAAPDTTTTDKDKKAVALESVNVVFSTTKTETPVIDIPQSVSTITPDRMHTYGVQGLDEAVRYLAGAVGGSYGADPRSDWILIRGYDPAKFLDGLALPNGDWTGDSRIEPYGLERVEVNKGPSSAMYGQLPPGGMIEMTSKRPSLEAPHEVEATVGSFNQRQLSGDTGGQFDKDGKWLWRLVALARKGDSNINHSKDDRYYFAPSVTWQPNDQTSLTVLARYQRSLSSGVGGFLPSQGTLYPNPNGQIPRDVNPGEPGYDHYNKTDESVGYAFSHRFDDTWTFRQDARVQNVKVDHRSIGSLGLQDDLRTLNRYNYPLVDHANVFAIDNQVEAQFAQGDVQHTVLMGLDYLYSRNDYKSGFGSAAPIDIFDPVYGAPIVPTPFTYHTNSLLEQLGAYVQDQIQVGRWGIVASGRKDWVSNDVTDKIGDSHTRQNDNAFSGRLGINYTTDIGLTPYLAYSHSFKTTVGQTFDGRAFRPITGDQYEGGVKYQTPGGRTLITAAVYQLTQKNALTVDPDHIFNSLQQGQTRTRGAELEANVVVTDHFSMTAAYAYTDAKVTHANDATLGKKVALVPKQQASLSGDYAVHGGSLDGLGFGGGVRYIGPHYGDANNLFRTGGYVIYDANAHYDMNNWRFQVTAANLFDREYVSACNSAAWCYYGYPRQVTVSARYRW